MFAPLCVMAEQTRERTLLNFLVNCPRGTMFVESDDASAYSKTGEKSYELLNQFVDTIGEGNMVQVVTDSAAANIFAGEIFSNSK